MTPLQLLQLYYVGLLIIQYAGLPKFTQFIELVVNQSLCDGLFLSLQTCFNLNTAIGAQLTIIGEIVGVPRNVYGIQPYATYFSFTRALGEPASIGFNRATTPIDPDFFLRAQVNASYTLSDFEMINLIKLKIIYNNTYSSFKALKNALYNTWDGAIDITVPLASGQYFNFTRASGTPASNGFNRATTPVDTIHFQRANQNTIMIINYNIKQPYYITAQVAQFLDILPRSMGIYVTVTFI
jgi:hypothetical protein